MLVDLTGVTSRFVDFFDGTIDTDSEGSNDVRSRFLDFFDEATDTDTEDKAERLYGRNKEHGRKLKKYP